MRRAAFLNTRCGFRQRSTQRWCSPRAAMGAKILGPCGFRLCSLALVNTGQ